MTKFSKSISVIDLCVDKLLLAQQESQNVLDHPKMAFINLNEIYIMQTPIDSKETSGISEKKNNFNNHFKKKKKIWKLYRPVTSNLISFTNLAHWHITDEDLLLTHSPDFLMVISFDNVATLDGV